MNIFEESLSISGRGQKISIEVLYQVFKKRMTEEVKITGGSNQGVVYGSLEDREYRTPAQIQAINAKINE